MDGIAIDSRSLAAGNRSFAIQATQGAGEPAQQLATPDGAVEVMTGAVVPGGTDCIIPQEEYVEAEGTARLKHGATGAPFRNIQRRGEDSRPDIAMLKRGVRLGAPEIAVAASAGLASVRVSRQPRFMIISTGDELIEPGRPITDYQVRRSNVYSIVAALRGRHFEDVQNDHIADDEALLRERLQQHLSTRDVLILERRRVEGQIRLRAQSAQEPGGAGGLLPGRTASRNADVVWHHRAQAARCLDCPAIRSPPWSASSAM